MKHLLILCALFMVLVFAGCGEKKSEDTNAKPKPKVGKQVMVDELQKVKVWYYSVYPPEKKPDWKTFDLSEEQMKKFRELFPKKKKYDVTDWYRECTAPDGGFKLEFKNGKTISFHFCSQKTTLHSTREGFVTVPEELHDFFVGAVEKHAGVKLKFGAGF